MEINRSNFRKALPLITESIEKADFIAIDAEFTGLVNGRDPTIFDTPKEYYIRLLNGSSEFLLIQFGLCAFYWDQDKGHYMTDAYNFYLFPRAKPGPEKFFLCQSSSLDFLATQKFDFNKLIREGISFMTEPMEIKLREILIEKQKNYSKEKDNVAIPDEQKPQIKNICANVRKFIDAKESDEMEIDKCNSFVRMLLYQELKAQFKQEVLVETIVAENKSSVLKVRRITSVDDIKDHEALKKQKEWEEFEDAVGFSRVARLISHSGKLVIGHNMVLDVMHTLNQFFQPLPSDYNMFKEFAHCMFPVLLDTKYMSSLPPFKDKVNSSILDHLMSTLSEAPFSSPKVECLEGRGYQVTEERHHEAGFDAYITGMCFLAMANFVGKMRGEAPGRFTRDSAALRPFLNKLFLARTAHHDSPYINLHGDDPSPTREHMFHLKFPKEWKRGEINELFSPFGAVTVSFVDESSALVALARREHARDIVRALRRNTRVSLTPYHIYKGMKGMHDDKNTERETKSSDIGTAILKPAESPDPQLRQVSPKAPPSPEKATRLRSNSVTLPEPVPRPTRKRTSSGMFQVDDSEPAPKKTEPVRSQTRSETKRNEASNGRRKETKNTKDNLKEKSKEKKEKVIQVFDSEAKTKCVSAFKESDSWD